MSPILGIVASSKPRVVALSGFVGIDSYTFTNNSQNSVTFSAIPQGYKHLYIFQVGQGTVNDGTRTYFNGDTGSSSYLGTNGWIANSNSTSGAFISNSTGIFDAFTLLGSSYGATQASAAVAYINDYSVSGKFKTLTVLGSNWNSGNEGGFRYATGTRTSSTDPITSITIAARTGNFNTNSKIALFGIN